MIQPSPLHTSALESLPAELIVGILSHDLAIVCKMRQVSKLFLRIGNDLLVSEAGRAALLLRFWRQLAPRDCFLPPIVCQLLAAQRGKGAQFHRREVRSFVGAEFEYLDGLPDSKEKHQKISELSLVYLEGGFASAVGESMTYDGLLFQNEVTPEEEFRVISCALFRNITAQEPRAALIYYEGIQQTGQPVERFLTYYRNIPFGALSMECCLRFVVAWGRFVEQGRSTPAVSEFAEQVILPRVRKQSHAYQTVVLSCLAALFNKEGSKKLLIDLGLESIEHALPLPGVAAVEAVYATCVSHPYPEFFEKVQLDSLIPAGLSDEEHANSLRLWLLALLQHPQKKGVKECWDQLQPIVFRLEEQSRIYYHLKLAVIGFYQRFFEDSNRHLEEGVALALKHNQLVEHINDVFGSAPCELIEQLLRKVNDQEIRREMIRSLIENSRAEFAVKVAKEHGLQKEEFLFDLLYKNGNAHLLRREILGRYKLPKCAISSVYRKDVTKKRLERTAKLVAVMDPENISDEERIKFQERQLAMWSKQPLSYKRALFQARFGAIGAMWKTVEALRESVHPLSDQGQIELFEELCRSSALK